VLESAAIASKPELVREFIDAHVLRHAAHGSAWNLPGLYVPALDWLRCGGSCRLCIMDMRLPDMDGNTAIRLLHQRYPQMTFLIHTGSSSYTLPDDLRAMGLDDHCIYHKPLADMGPLAAEVRARALTRERRP